MIYCTMASTNDNAAVGLVTEEPAEEGPPGISILSEINTKEKDEAADIASKISPVCRDETMKLEATTLEELRPLCFPQNFSLIEAQLDLLPGLTSASYSSQSTSISSKQSKAGMYSCTTSDNDIDTVLTQLMEKSVSINPIINNMTVSRHGRSTQRWIVDAQTSQVIRLVAGCVPILKGGKIMMVSSNKHNEWILPKGGWEMDEDLEVSAIRETFEEAGVLGILGPKLSEIHYETRKSRKKRLTLEENLKANPEIEGQFSSGWSDVSQLSEEDHFLERDHSPKNQRHTEMSPETPKKPQVHVTVQPAGNAKGLDISHQADKLAQVVPPEMQVDPEDHITSSTPMDYNYVRVNMFPLYVQEIKSEWPESGRLRRAVDIDQAIQLLENRPELQAILIEVKEKGMHRV